MKIKNPDGSWTLTGSDADTINSIEKLKDIVGVKKDLPENPTLDDYKYDKIFDLEEACNNAIRSGFWSAAHGDLDENNNPIKILYGYDNTEKQPDQLNLMKRYLSVKEGFIPESQNFYKPKGESEVQYFTMDQFKLLIADAAAHEANKLAFYYQLRYNIKTATTKEQLDAIDITNIDWDNI